MAGNSTDLIAEFQKLRQETSGISQNLMARTRSVDDRRESNSNFNNEVRKVIEDGFASLHKEHEAVQRKLTEENHNQKQLIENLQKKQEEDKSQNELMKQVLEELRFVRIEIAVMKRNQEEDRKEMENIKTITNQIRETLRNPKIVELCGYWTPSQEHPSFCDPQLFKKNQFFSEKGNMLTWSICKNERLIHYATVRVGSNECKIREDGKIAMRLGTEIKMELDVNGATLVIEYWLFSTPIKFVFNKCIS